MDEVDRNVLIIALVLACFLFFIMIAIYTDGFVYHLTNFLNDISGGYFQ